MIYQDNIKSKKLNISVLIISMILFFVSNTSFLYGVNDSDDSEDKISKAVVKAALVRQVSNVTEYHGKGWGGYLTEWIIDRIYAPRSGSFIRRLLSWSDADKVKDQWKPAGQIAGKYFVSIVSSVIVIGLVDRYYSPWKRVSSSLLIGDFKLQGTKQGDFQKVIESSILGPCAGYFIYFDLTKGKK